MTALPSRQDPGQARDGAPLGTVIALPPRRPPAPVLPLAGRVGPATARHLASHADRAGARPPAPFSPREDVADSARDGAENPVLVPVPRSQGAQWWPGEGPVAWVPAELLLSAAGRCACAGCVTAYVPERARKALRVVPAQLARSC